MMALALAVLIGLSLGILGSGGSIVTLPVLVYVAKISPSQAVGMSLAIVGGTSLLGAVLQFRKGNLHLKAVLLFSITGVIGAFVGSGATHLFVQAGAAVGIRRDHAGGGLVDIERASAIEGRPPVPGVAVPGGGVGGGGPDGISGGGRRFLIVPALVMAAGLSVRMSGGTSLAIIALNSASGLVGQARFVRVDWGLLILFLALACGGMLAGLAVADRVPEKNLRRIFAGALIALAIFVIAMNV